MQTKETIIRIVLVALLVYSLLSFVSVKRETAEAEKKAEELSEQLSELEKENERLIAAAKSADSDEEICQLARDRLGLVMPGEKIFYFNSDESR